MTARPLAPTSLRRLARAARPQRGEIAGSVAMSVATVAAGMGLLGTSGWLLTRAAQGPDLADVALAVVGVRFFGLARAVSRYLERLSGHRAALALLAAAQVRAYRALEPLAPAGLHPLRRGDLLARLVADVEVLRDAFLRVLAPPLVAAGVGLLAVVLAGVVAPPAAAVVAAGWLLGAVAVPALAARWSARDGRSLAARRGALAAELTETLGAAPELAVAGTAAAHLARLRDLDEELARSQRRAATRAGVLEALVVATGGAVVAGVAIVGTAVAAAGEADPLGVAAVTLATLAALEALAPLPGALARLPELRGAAGRLAELEDLPAPVAETPEPLPLPPGTDVALRGVRVVPDPQRPPALDGVDLDLPAGSTVAVLGPSGSGKTTLAHLLVRLVDPTAGEVRLGGVDLRRLAGDDVRARVGLAGPDTWLFATTVAANVRLARPDAPDGDVRAALDAAGLAGMDPARPAGENGSQLSGGEQRRLALARARCDGPAVLVVDEPGSGLDPATARSVLADLLDDALACGRTLVVLAHEPADLHGMDDRFDAVHRLARGRLTRCPG